MRSPNVTSYRNNMPKNLAKQLVPIGLDADAIATLFGSIVLARDSEPEVRAGVIRAYNSTVRPMYVGALIIGLSLHPHQPYIF